MRIVSLMFWSVDILAKITFWNTVYVFAYFVVDTKIICGYNFAVSLIFLPYSIEKNMCFSMGYALTNKILNKSWKTLIKQLCRGDLKSVIYTKLINFKTLRSLIFANTYFRELMNLQNFEQLVLPFCRSFFIIFNIFF